MNTDIRLSINFFTHPKTVKLIRQHGFEGVVSLLRLWLWTAQNRPGGALSGMDTDDIEIVSGWSGDPGAFIAAITALRFLDAIDDGYRIHDWEEHNPWQSEVESRADKARFSRLRQVSPDEYARLRADGVNAISKSDYCRITSARRISGDITAALGDPLATPEIAKAICDGSPATPGLCSGPSPSPAPFQLLSRSSPDPALNAMKKTPCQVFGEDSEPYRLALLMRDTLKANVPTLKEPDLQKWAQSFDVAIRNDARMKDANFVERVITWACSDSFWRANIQSPSKLREKFDQLTAKMETESAKQRASPQHVPWKSPAQRRLESNQQAGKEAKRLLFGEHNVRECQQ